MTPKATTTSSNLHKRDISRRRFVKCSAAAVVGAAIVGTQRATGKGRSVLPPELSKRILGRTGLEVTDFGFGGNQLQQSRLLEIAIERGINLVHTSRGYTDGVGIKATGEVMKSQRDKVFLALQASPIGGIDDDLRTLNTDYVDILLPQIHSVDDMDPELEDAFGKLREEGKIRFSGFANHKNPVSVLNLAVDKGFFDVMLVAYNLGNREAVDPVLARAKEEQNMGFIAMKTFNGLEKDDAPAVTSGLKSLLQNDNVHSLLIGMGAVGEVQSNVEASGARMGWMDRVRARRNVRLASAACMMCGACEAACPKGIAVADIVRCNLYYDRGEKQLARSTYRGLPAGARMTACDDCGLCERACPKSRPVRDELHRAALALA